MKYPMSPGRRLASAIALAAAAFAAACTGSTNALAQSDPAPAAATASGDIAPLQLPLRLTSLIGHTGTSVTDVVASATFYAKLVGGKNLSGERLPTGSVRYYMRLGESGSVAIGQLGTLGSVGKTEPLIDHLAIGAETYNDPAWRARLKAEGLPYIAQAVFLDPDGIPIQVAGGQGGEGLAAGSPTRLADLYTGQPLVAAKGFDHVVLRVNDVEKAAAFWKKFFGVDVVARNDGMAWVSDGKVRLGLRRVSGNETPGIEYQAIRTGPFDTAQMRMELEKLGAHLLPAMPYDKAGTIHFVGPDGIKAALVQD